MKAVLSSWHESEERAIIEVLRNAMKALRESGQVRSAHDGDGGSVQDMPVHSRMSPIADLLGDSDSMQPWPARVRLISIHVHFNHGPTGKR